jgi:hypothetical protein
MPLAIDDRLLDSLSRLSACLGSGAPSDCRLAAGDAVSIIAVIAVIALIVHGWRRATMIWYVKLVTDPFTDVIAYFPRRPQRA